jgi:hypothetical protein
MAMTTLAWAAGMMTTLVIAARRRRHRQLQTSLRRAYTHERHRGGRGLRR